MIEEMFTSKPGPHNKMALFGQNWEGVHRALFINGHHWALTKHTAVNRLHISERTKDVDQWRQKASKTKLYTTKEHGRNLEKHPEQTKTNRQGAIYRNALFTDRLQTELGAILSFYHY